MSPTTKSSPYPPSLEVVLVVLLFLAKSKTNACAGGHKPFPGAADIGSARGPAPAPASRRSAPTPPPGPSPQRGRGNRDRRPEGSPEAFAPPPRPGPGRAGRTQPRERSEGPHARGEGAQRSPTAPPQQPGPRRPPQSRPAAARTHARPPAPTGHGRRQPPQRIPRPLCPGFRQSDNRAPGGAANPRSGGRAELERGLRGLREGRGARGRAERGLRAGPPPLPIGCAGGARPPIDAGSVPREGRGGGTAPRLSDRPRPRRARRAAGLRPDGPFGEKNSEKGPGSGGRAAW